jgi:hypothetical protein
MLEKNNYNYKFIGVNEKWDGWYGRLNSYLNFIRNLDPDTFLVLCDARDVLINQDSSSFISKAIKMYNNKVIFGVEMKCCTINITFFFNNKSKKRKNKKYIKYMKEKAMEKSGQDYYYSLNFGLQFGKAKDIIKLFELMNIQPGDDDQGLAYKVFYEYPDIIELDYKNNLFSNCVDLEKTDEIYKWNNNEWISLKTGSVPSFIQTPGKNWECYNKLLEKLI